MVDADPQASQFLAEPRREDFALVIKIGENDHFRSSAKLFDKVAEAVPIRLSADDLSVDSEFAEAFQVAYALNDDRIAPL
jgi:hypothetical protein